METTAHFRFSTAVLRRLGEELNPHPDQGLLELVKNSFDADARQCGVELRGTSEVGGSVRVVDNGDGMNAIDIEAKWLLLGSSTKSGERTRLGRHPAGSKGLGRLAALRLGERVSLRTRTRADPSTEHVLEIDWKLFDAATTVESVELQIASGPAPQNAKCGVEIEIDGLRTAITPADVKRLARAMVLLADPFDDPTGFRPSLLAPEYKSLERLVSRKYFDFADYRISATLSEQGRPTLRVLDNAERELASTTVLGPKRERCSYRAPAAQFDLWAFNLGGDDFVPGGPTRTELQAWLREVGGVHVYQNGIRVQPYGDEGHDWLDMNLRRARSPELRPSTNNALGRVRIHGSDESLQQKTDRTGFIENEAYRELRQFAVDSLEWVAKWRLSQRELRRSREKVEVPKEIKAAAEVVRQAIQTAPVKPAQRKRIEAVFQKYEKSRERYERDLYKEVLLYRTLCTVGTTAATFSHESKKPLTNIVRASTVLESLGKKLGLFYKGDFKTSIELIGSSARGLQGFTKVTTRLLDHEKRRRGRVDVHNAIREVVSMLKPHLDRMTIAIELDLKAEGAAIHGTEAAIESIIMNLLTNSMNAVRRGGHKKRRINVRTSAVHKLLRMEVLDSGPGICDLPIDDIWLPGQTTTPHGTGLGLTIVRDSTSDLGGRTSALANGELGGATMTVELPLL